jgi:hypothetical protein
MAINYCTLTSSTLDAFCGNRRAIVLERLIDELRPVIGPAVSNPQSKWITARPPQKWEPPALPTELERILVTAQFQELSGSSTQEVRSQLELVTVTDVHVQPTKVVVNIENLRVNHAVR